MKSTKVQDFFRGEAGRLSSNEEEQRIKKFVVLRRTKNITHTPILSWLSGQFVEKTREVIKYDKTQPGKRKRKKERSAPGAGI